MNTNSINQLSPMAALRRLVGKLRSALHLDFVADAAEVEIAREEADVTACTREAETLDVGLAHARDLFAHALHDRKTPGVITVAEARPILRELIRDSARAHQHREHLHQLID